MRTKLVVRVPCRRIVWSTSGLIACGNGGALSGPTTGSTGMSSSGGQAGATADPAF